MATGFTGPGLYQILPSYAEDKSLNVWTGTKDQGAEIKLFGRNPDTANTYFEIVAAGGSQGHPGIGEKEYHIIASHSGLYLTWPGKQGEQITQQLRSPLDASIRFKIKTTSSGGVQFTTLDGKSQLNVAGTGRDDGTRVIQWQNEGEGANTVFYLPIKSLKK